MLHKPNFYIIKLGFTGYTLFFLTSLRRFKGVSTIYVLSRIMKNIIFLSANVQCLEVKFSICLNRRVFLMGVRAVSFLGICTFSFPLYDVHVVYAVYRDRRTENV